MLGIDYVSSDEEDVSSVAKPEPKPPLPAVVSAPEPAPAPVEEKPAPTALPEGPAQGPSATPLPEDDETQDITPPGSPFTSNRLMMQSLTLPPVPNLDIPPSPPGSPPQKSTKKFAQFLELKKNGQHFNQRLEGSPVVRDPNHSRKLMDFAGINDEDQYVSTLPEGLGVPAVWPEWAYGDALNASQKKINKVKESERSKVPRYSVDFVPAESGASSGSGTPAGKKSRQSAAERVMAGLDRPKDRR
ncbi:hypothetical protein BU23DRAFT_555897 [Bimuria novae-zelandiae CBS 107.79]|uniref:HCNGP-domain-containing protein n=1 Tax=Bimuria novae-zelandiae CBS 107.79 TaxID=1447943 RepID=A0A6A5V538_9PLEO|nr:hypothetical protein BU23DRAFT_555897 [Bimuria novae-zelandiae CBS 107.79]